MSAAWFWWPRVNPKYSCKKSSYVGWTVSTIFFFIPNQLANILKTIFFSSRIISPNILNVPEHNSNPMAGFGGHGPPYKIPKKCSLLSGYGMSTILFFIQFLSLKCVVCPRTNILIDSWFWWTRSTLQYDPVDTLHPTQSQYCLGFLSVIPNQPHIIHH